MYMYKITTAMITMMSAITIVTRWRWKNESFSVSILQMASTCLRLMSISGKSAGSVIFGMTG